MAARVLVVDDEPTVRSQLRRSLALEGYEVLLAEDGETALSVAESAGPDVIVLDVMMPGVDGFTVCEKLRRAGNTPIIMLTALETVPDRITGLDRGADDYLVKPFAEGELNARIRALLRRTQADSGESLSYADVEVNVAARRACRNGQPLRLTSREFELLALFLRHPDRALSREQICQQVWGYAFEGESNFVDVAVKELRKKLEVDGGERVIQTLRGFGYVLREE